MPLATPTTLTTLCLSESHTHSFILHFLEVNLSVGCVNVSKLTGAPAFCSVKWTRGASSRCGFIHVKLHKFSQ